MENREERIIELADTRAVEFLEARPDDKISPEHRKLLSEQALFGFRAKQEITKNHRLEKDQQLRAIRLFVDPAVRDEYAKLTAAKLLPELKSRPGK
jgi:hypothetical protein